MNIFILENGTSSSAKALADIHVKKMYLETLQILCGVHWVFKEKALFEPLNLNHPAIKWASESRSNYVWLIEYAGALKSEYKIRFKEAGSKREDNKLDTAYKWLHANGLHLRSPVPFKRMGPTKKPLIMPDLYKRVADLWPKEFSKGVIMAYREYYYHEKYKIASWDHTSVPTWFSKHKCFLHKAPDTSLSTDETT